MLKKVNGFLTLIKFSHSVFALPFALTAFALAWVKGLGALSFAETLGWVVLAMVGARTGAMGFNRLVDIPFDAANPRTQSRPSVTGEVSKPLMVVMILLSYTALVYAAFRLSPLAFYLSPVAIFLVSFYSFTKRFTFLCHFFLGLAIGAAPIASWIAVTGEISATSLLIGGGVFCWISGFDIIYALQDHEYDAGEGLHSVPVVFGVKKSLWFARGLHSVAFTTWMLLAKWEGLGYYYLAAVAISTMLLVYEHWLLKDGDLQKIDMAFFNMNAYISMLLFIGVSLDLYMSGYV
ncbi:MAG: UbiA-like polyprenyltransferase [SAR324 cluster bacterium]|nr:UbiA-like polyprenyltransferase [SAR324 cluster bacterium]